MKSQSFIPWRWAVLYFCCGVKFAFSQADFWEPTEVPVDAVHGVVRALGINANGDIYAGSDGIYRSTDRGDSWTYLSGRDSLDVAFFATNSQGHIFAGTKRICEFRTGSCVGGGVYRSIDNGATWQRVGLANRNIYGLVIDSNDNIFAADSGIYRSTDNGNTWTPINAGLVTLGVLSLAVNSSGHLFAGTGGSGIFRSTNKGDLWAPANVGLISHYISTISSSPDGDLFAGAGDDIYRSTNHGDSWTPLNSGFDDITVVATNASGHVFVHDNNRRLFRSTDDGDSWESVWTDRIVYTLVSDVNNSLFAGTSAGVFRSFDNGDHWLFSSRNVLTDATVNNLVINSAGVLFAASDESVFRSVDNGRRWAPINTGLPRAPINFLAIHASGDLFVGTHGEPFFGATDSLFRSQDNGDHWTSIKTGLANTEIRAFAINSEGHLFIGTLGAGVLRSTDSGGTWSPINTGLTDRFVRALAINANGHLFAGTFAGIFRSTSNGENWTPVNIGLTSPFILSFAFGSNGLVFAGGEPAHRSIDNGDHWAPITDFPGAYAFIENSSGYIFAATWNGVFSSIDNGESWIPINSGLTNSTVLTLAINPDGYLFAGTQRGIFRSIETTTSVKEISSELPMSFSLEQNYPNPFNPNTKIHFALRRPSFVTLKVYNILGKEVATLVTENLAAGKYEVDWNASGLASGVYLYRLQAGEFIETKKLTVLR
jgi:ligand-binding sensor domain-containing protein